MKRFTRIMSLLLCLCMVFPAFTAAAETDVPDYFVPELFGQMYNESAEALADRYYTHLSEEELAQVKEDCILTRADGNDLMVILDSETRGVEVSFGFDDLNPETGKPAALWHFSISRNISGEAINLAAYTLMMMISYTYQDTVSKGELNDWFNSLDTENGFRLPGYTLSMNVSEEWITYQMVPEAGKKTAGQQENSGDGMVEKEIRFENLPWGCDMDTAKLLLKAAGLLTEEAEGRFDMMKRVLSVGGRSATSYTCFRKVGNTYTVEHDGEASNIVEVPLMSGMVKQYMGRDVHHITLLFLVEGNTQKLLNVNVSFMVSGESVLPVLTEKYGQPLQADDGEYDARFWFGENGTGLCWTSFSVNYGLLDAQAMIEGK